MGEPRPEVRDSSRKKAAKSCCVPRRNGIGSALRLEESTDDAEAFAILRGLDEKAFQSAARVASSSGKMLAKRLDAPRGFEPRLTESESVVLPLDDGAAPLRQAGEIESGRLTVNAARPAAPDLPSTHSIVIKPRSSQPPVSGGEGQNGRVSWRRVSPVRRLCSRIPLSRAGRRIQSRRWRRDQHRHTYGAIDLGTNNCRLLIARPTDGGFTVIDAFSRIVRLGEGLSRTGKLSDEAMDRAVGALRSAPTSCAAATSRCRARSPPKPAAGPSNGREFAERVRRRDRHRARHHRARRRKRGWRCSAATSCSSPATGRR